MARVALDAGVVIAFLDPSDAQHAVAVQALGPHLAAGAEILISATVYAEVIVRPLQQGTVGKVDEFLAAIGAHVIDVDRPLARFAADLRARNRPLRLPDAIAPATALTRDAQFLTLDRSLQQVGTKER